MLVSGTRRSRQAVVWLGVAATAVFLLVQRFSPSPHTANLQLHVEANTAAENPVFRRETNRALVETLHDESRDVTPILTFVPGIGRLGNRLFQYASTFGLARQSGRELVVSQDDHLLDMFSGINASVLADKVQAMVVWEEQSMIYSPGLQELPEDPSVAVCCYLQSWRYFYGHEHALRNQFTVSLRLRTVAAAILAEVKQIYSGSTGADSADVTLVGVHVRRQDMSREAQLRRGYVPAPPGYVRRAMSHYENLFPHVVFVMCSDDPGWCKDEFQEELGRGKVVLLEGGSPQQDLATLAACDHIIMTVGTFGWWAGWLAAGNVTYFSGWPAPGSEIDSHYRHEDFFPPQWTPLA